MKIEKPENILAFKATCDVTILIAYTNHQQKLNSIPVNIYSYKDQLSEEVSNNELKLNENQSNSITTGKRFNYYYLLNDLTLEIINQKQFLLKDKSLSYLDKDLDLFIYLGISPLKNQIIVPINNFSYDYNSNIITTITPLEVTIKARSIQTKLNLLKMELIEENQEDLDEQNQNVHINEKAKRSKERKIGYIIEKVFLWRKLYNGFVDESGNYVKLTLEEAADRVGIAKKSLDDYLIQLRIGKMNGFNFNEHKNDKVGVLRAFVKKQKNIFENKSITRDNLKLEGDDLTDN
jgi:hypothetical protein